MSSSEGAVRPNHPLRHPLRPSRVAAAAAGTPAWPTFTGTATLVGTSSCGVTVYVDQALGAQGTQNANSLLSAADRVVAQNNAIFGIAGGDVSVIMYAIGGSTDGTGGADHGGCDFKVGNAIEVDASFGSPNRVIGLLEAELSECAMNGSLCGYSTGEALSRWCAATVSGNALSDYATAPAWAQAGMPDWVNQTEQTDGGAVSTGCGMAFISWLLSNGKNLSQIAPAMVGLGDSGTLAALYAKLTGDAGNKAWTNFQAAVAALPGPITTDDPFNGMSSIPIGVFDVAIQTNTGVLGINSDGTPSSWADTNLGMMGGTSPSIAALPGGGYAVAFQTNTGVLGINSDGTPDNWADTNLGMMAGTSPSIAALPGGGYAVAFQTNTGVLGINSNGTPDNWADTNLGMMAGTSPSIATLPCGYTIAFQANTGNLWITDGIPQTGIDTKLGMMAGTSPSIAL